jgi:thioester reductase-like protein
VYRPAIVVGHSQTGEMDKIDGPYYFFKLIQKLRGWLPQWFPLVGPELGNTNVVPVDYVARRWTTSPTSPTSTARPST